MICNWQPLFRNNFSVTLRAQELLKFPSLLLIIIPLVIAPILEELLFRGILLEYLSRTNGVMMAVVLSSFFFSLHHLTLSQLLPAFLGGIYLGVLYLKTYSLSSTILAHVCFNMIPVFISI